MNYPLFTPNSDKLNHIELRFNEGSPLFSKALNYVMGKKHNGIIIVFGNFIYDNENEISYVNITLIHYALFNHCVYQNICLLILMGISLYLLN